jgi:hypothetical protein
LQWILEGHRIGEVMGSVVVGEGVVLGSSWGVLVEGEREAGLPALRPRESGGLGAFNLSLSGETSDEADRGWGSDQGQWQLPATAISDRSASIAD